jgi:hypothetical protein
MVERVEFELSPPFFGPSDAELSDEVKLQSTIPERSSQKPIATHRFLERDNPQARSALVVFEAAPPSSAPDTTVSIIIKGTDARLSSQTR